MLVIKYAFFALISTIVNLFTQYLFLLLGHNSFTFYIGLLAGTLTGLATKYLLDKKWIFYYQPSSKADNLNKFGLYSLMGVFTTFIFWGCEFLFRWAFEYPYAHLIGGAIGLSIGYFTKYMLDKKFVFVGVAPK